jgi:squalene-hopene/tetraprenyl-beta-curcumene cyclase
MDQDLGPISADLLDVPARAELIAKVDLMIDRSSRALLGLQHPEGYWQGALEVNAEMNAEYIIFNRFMELSPDRELDNKLAKQILETQQKDGSWGLFPGGEGDLSTTIEAYFGLKLTGMRAGDESLVQARRWALSKGGIANSNTLARFYLAMMDQVPWCTTAAMPVEITLLPKWFPFNMYELSSWARGTLFALMILQARKPTIQVDWHQGVRELYIRPSHFTEFTTPRGHMLSVRNLLRRVDKALGFYDRHHLKSLRTRALRNAENWLLQHQDANGSWGGIQPCYLLSTMALKGLGYRNDHPVIVKGVDAARELIWDLGDSIIYQPCVSPNWDTALAVKALLDAGLPRDHPALRAASKWLIEHQIFRKGDWSIKRPDLEPGGWAFQFCNDWYPDVDDSAVILTVLAGVAYDDAVARERSIKLGVKLSTRSDSE